MLIIGGSPRSGKTTVSKIFSENNNQEILHLDDLRAQIYKNLSQKEKQEVFFLLYSIKKYSNIDKKLFIIFEKNKKILEILKKIGCKTNFEKFLKEFGEEKYFQEEFSISKFITKYFLQNFGNNIIIEGVSVCPQVLNTFEIEKENIMFLVKSDIQDILEVLEKNPGSFKNRNTKKMSEIILKYGEKIANEAEKYNFSVIDTSKNDIFQQAKDGKYKNF